MSGNDIFSRMKQAKVKPLSQENVPFYVSDVIFTDEAKVRSQSEGAEFRVLEISMWFRVLEGYIFVHNLVQEAKKMQGSAGRRVGRMPVC